MALGTQVNTLASNGLNGTWKIAADKIDVRPSAVSDGVTVHADTLSRNLASTNIELVSTKGDLDLDGSVSWASGNRLGLGSAADLTLNGRLNSSGAKAGLELKAEGAIDINDKIVLGGAGSALAMDAGEGHRVNGTASVSLAGANATYVSGGYYYTVVQNLAQLQAINKNLDGLYVLGGNILGGSYYCTALQSIGGPAGVFSGTLDGLGNSIGNLSISNTGPNVGLFARSSGTLSNLKLNNLRVSDNTYGSGPSSLGALVGINSGRIANVSASGSRSSAADCAPTHWAAWSGAISTGRSRTHPSAAASPLMRRARRSAVWWGELHHRLGAGGGHRERPQQRPCGCTVHRAQQPGRRRRPGRTECEGHDQGVRQPGEGRDLPARPERRRPGRLQHVRPRLR